MKIRHRVPPEAWFTTEPVSAEYQAQIDRAMERAASREREALRRFAAAETRLHRAERIKPRQQRERAVLVAREAVEARRQELLAVQRQMEGAPASAEHRSRKGRHRPIVPMKTI